MSAAMEAAFGRHAVGVTPITGVYGPAYDDDGGWHRAVEGIAAVGQRMGRKPRILVAKMGQDGHDRGANVVASAFADRSEEHTSELQSLMRISYAVFCLKKKQNK